jgi:hypothetical protein
MSTSDKKILANRINGKKSHGPIDKTRTKPNALRHGLLAVGITQLDDAEGYRKLVRELKREMNPVGTLETQLVEAAASDMVRWARARRLEAEYITEVLNPPKHERDPLGDVLSDLQGRIVDPGVPAALKPGSVQCLVAIYQRYETIFANRLFRTLHEFERLQRLRLGERLPAPIAVDVSVRAETGTADSIAPEPEPSKTTPGDSAGSPAPVTVDVKNHADNGLTGHGPAESEQQTVLPGDGENVRGGGRCGSGGSSDCQVGLRSGGQEAENSVRTAHDFSKLAL